MCWKDGVYARGAHMLGDESCALDSHARPILIDWMVEVTIG